MKPLHTRRPGAPKGNRNAAGKKRGTGLRGTFYLNMADLQVLDDALASHGIAPSNKTRLQAARDLLHAALRTLQDSQDEPPIII